MDYIQSILKIGKVSIDPKGSSATFKISAKKELLVVLTIFGYFHLNTTKHLDFLSFAQAYELYNKSSKHSQRAEIKPLIETLGNSRNKQRTDWVMPLNHNYKVTSYWLLGFIEGDGSFYITSRDNLLAFSITQKGNRELLRAIKDFMINLVRDSQHKHLYESAIKIYSKNREITILRLYNTDFIEFVFIPFLDGLIWQSKKYLDYRDWKVLLEIFKRGLHCTFEGEALINRIRNQMNNQRLSSSKIPCEDRSVLLADITEILKQPSNYEYREDKIFVKSSQKFISDKKAISVLLMDSSSDNEIQSFSSYASCGKFLGLHHYTVSLKVNSGAQFTFQGKGVYLKKN